jgi:glycosyltransferase involved in cell wall biosynthesis
MKKKVLFVTHALESLYGAATSLRLLLRQYGGEVEFDLLLSRSLRRPRDLAAVARMYGARNAFELSLPLDHHIVRVDRNFMDKAHIAAHWIMWQRDRFRFREILRKNRYDIIHLNTVGLYGMMVPGGPFVTHVREVPAIDSATSSAMQKLANGLGLIFIDAATQDAFRHVHGRARSIVLNNPVDMTDIASFSGALVHPRLTPTTTVFSVLGMFMEEKGVDFIIQAFRKGAGADALLLIVGAGAGDYLERCRQSAGDDPRIVFWGEEREVKRVYAATDYVVRGEPYNCIGRTVYEGLYAGCRIILQRTGQGIPLFDAELFQDRVQYYPARDPQALADLFTACTGKKVQNRVGLENIVAYANTFDTFLDECIADGRQRKMDASGRN